MKRQERRVLVEGSRDDIPALAGLSLNLAQQMGIKRKMIDDLIERGLLRQVGCRVVTTDAGAAELARERLKQED